MHTSHCNIAQVAQILLGKVDEWPIYYRTGKGTYTDSQIKKYIKPATKIVAEGVFKRLIRTPHILRKAKPSTGHYRSRSWAVPNGKRCVYVS